jgi:hypothetical protein
MRLLLPLLPLLLKKHKGYEYEQPQLAPHPGFAKLKSAKNGLSRQTQNTQNTQNFNNL